MANPWIKKIGGTLAGMVAAMLVVGGVEAIGHLMFPPPAGLDISKPEDQARLMATIPLGAKISVVVGWFMGALVGAWTALRFSGARWSPIVIGAMMAGLCIMTTQMFPHPLWMVIAALVLPILASWLVLRARPKDVTTVP